VLLALDTATPLVSVALHDGERVVVEHSSEQPMKHGEHLAPLVARAMSDAGIVRQDLTAIAVGVGPGPFTGLRVGIVTGRTFAFALGLPVRGLTSLDAIAHEAWLAGHRGDLLVATDARRKEVYAAAYVLGDERTERVTEPAVARAADLPAAQRALPTAGRGASLYPDSLPRPFPLLDVSGGALADLAVRRLRDLPSAAVGDLQWVGPGQGFDGLEPLYLRRPDAAPAPPSTKSTLG
jgi:tRNA threonylcarbamoyladenosine biosynthesis protein TsaB